MARADKGTRYLAAVVLGLPLMLAAPAVAQSNNPAATINGTIPTSEGNVWGGADHQPTEADVPPATEAQQAKINRKLQKLDEQLMNAPLPKVPSGAPPVAGSQ